MSEMRGKMIYQIRRYEIFQARMGLNLFNHRFKLVSSYVPRDIWLCCLSVSRLTVTRLNEVL